MARSTIKETRTKGSSPKFQFVREELRDRILSGHYPAGSRLPTDVELPKQFNVSRLTVQRALGELVREGLIVRRRGSGTFVADRHQPPLIPNRHLKIGLLWPSYMLPENLVTIPGTITKGILEEWGLLRTAPKWQPARDGKATGASWHAPERNLCVECIGQPYGIRQGHPCLEDVVDRSFDAFLSIGVYEADWLEQVIHLGRPTVIADYLDDRFQLKADQVYFDPMPGYRAAVRYFAQQGFKRIHFVGGLVGNPSGPGLRVDPDTYLRLSAYRQGLDECGLQQHESSIHYASSDKQSLLALAKKWVGLPNEERPEVAICHSVQQADYLMEQFAGKGLALQGCGIAGVGELNAAIPIRAYGKNIGAAAASLLISRLKQPERPNYRVGVALEFEDPAAR